MIILYMAVDQDNLILDKKLISHLSKERQQAISLSKNGKHSILSMYAELLLKFGFFKYYGIEEELVFSKTDNGKPYISSLQDFDVNISHTSNMVMCGITNKGQIGVDVEHQRRIHKNVSLKVYHPDEISYVNEISDLCEDRFFEIWTKKEAYTKYLGTGLRNNITDINMLSKEHSDKLIHWSYKPYYFSVYSDDAISNPIKVTVEELQGYFL